MGEANMRFARGDLDDAIKMCEEVIRLCKFLLTGSFQFSITHHYLWSIFGVSSFHSQAPVPLSLSILWGWYLRRKVTMKRASRYFLLIISFQMLLTCVNDVILVSFVHLVLAHCCPSELQAGRRGVGQSGWNVHGLGEAQRGYHMLLQRLLITISSYLSLPLRTVLWIKLVLSDLLSN